MYKQTVNIGFATSIILLTLAIPALVTGFIEGRTILAIFVFCFYLIAGTKFYKYIYPKFLNQNRNSERWCTKKLTIEESGFVEDAINLLKRVDKNIVIYDFNVYKVKFINKGWFKYDEETKELNIFIPFKFFLRLGGEYFCFMAVLHEILHSLNLKNNMLIFKRNFLEGLNQILTIWLIENYSEKYEIPKNKSYILELTKKSGYEITITPLANTIYIDDVNMVKDILQKANVDLKEVFLKYIDFKPEYFKSFVPSKYFEKE